ncbi:kinesin-like protein KIN-UA isoform X1 [Zingiber officinale]|uniref:kinesin-like protein KIN-UA isoform X1 n=1 Tax=Zingiber officinale TaxID=94328 RepID=UPI001C4D47DC|nr:kinesin-like protein KIN-UA isoform X1 [Zingiber officinale]
MASNGHSRASVRTERQVPPTKASGGGNPPARPRASSAKRSSRVSVDDDNDSVRVRVAVRVRPKNTEELNSDFADCVELQPELKRLKLKKNNWSLESYKFDEVFTQSASQRRVYEAVAKPVVESVLDGYNGTVMAYGQTGTGKTYTVGQLGKNDPSERGIMVRALEGIFANTTAGSDTVTISYLQLYLESVQDLLSPEKTNIPIVEDPKTGEVSLPGSAVVQLNDLDHFLELLQAGEANRHAANTKLNTESSRSHAMLVVHVHRSFGGKKENEVSSLSDGTNDNLASHHVPHILKSKLLIVDLAGSERIDKSGIEGRMIEETKFINLSLTSLGKCINALAENNPYIPTRDSKLTRLLRDSFGGSARTSLIVTVGPSAQYYSETASTILFGQRAMKVVNTVKLKEEVDYESLCKKLEYHVDYLTSETDRQQKLREIEREQMEKKLKEQEALIVETKIFVSKYEYLEKQKNHWELEAKKLLKELNIQKNENDRLSQEIGHLEENFKQIKQQELESSTHQKILADMTNTYQKNIAELINQLESERSHCTNLEEQLSVMKKSLSDNIKSVQERIVDDLARENSKLNEIATSKIQSLEVMNRELLMEKERIVDDLTRENSKLNEITTSKIQPLEVMNRELLMEKDFLNKELESLKDKLLDEERQRRCLEGEIVKLKKFLIDGNAENGSKRSHWAENSTSSTLPFENPSKSHKSRESVSAQKDTISKIFEEVGLSNILPLLKSEELDVQIHAVKVVANLAAEDINQERIVKEGGLDALLILLEISKDATVHRITAGALANLAMNGSNQSLIVSKGGTRLLANIASKTEDPQTLRMIAGAIANLCGNEKLHVMLKKDSGIKALLQMMKSGHSEVIAQVARGFANFAKCESRGIAQGYQKGKSVLIEEGALYWMITNSSTYSASTRRHIELALCHLAQNEDNALDLIRGGGIKELIRISQDSSKEETRNLAKKALDSNSSFSSEMYTS